ncbi:hypothetical protein NBRC116602_20670 [Hyphomicrobiales bacterium 4NK60-0047b]|jgi:uncharacterized metal-binding protein YceD (DUF177 family)
MSFSENFLGPINLVIPIKDIGDSGIERTLNLDDEQKAFFIKELGLSAFDAFKCQWQLKALHKNRYRLTAEINADITQLSALSLEPVKYEINENFKTEFWPIEQNDPDKSPELEIDYADEIIEFYEKEEFNIGQIIYENFVIAIEQFPRKEGEVFNWENNDTDDEEKPNPFAALKVLKNKE